MTTYLAPRFHHCLTTYLAPEVPPSPDYIPCPEVPPSPDYIPGPEVPPSPDYIPGPEEPQFTSCLKTPIQTRHMTKINDEHGLISSVHKLRRTNHKDFQNCLFACFLSQMEPKKLVQALKDPSWVEVIQDELLQNKKDERGIVVKNKARLMDIKSAFLYGKIEDEMYVRQPPGFEDPDFPDKVYKVEKALYRLHQALRA
ncbi:putative ribonuclease H-like domain-containing protein, partial [Tanacetum coccineum]